MSLISDALRVAQREHELKHQGTSARRAVVDGFFAVDRRGQRMERRRWLLAGSASGVLALALLSTVAIRWDGGSLLASAGAAPLLGASSLGGGVPVAPPVEASEPAPGDVPAGEAPSPEPVEGASGPSDVPREREEPSQDAGLDGASAEPGDDPADAPPQAPPPELAADLPAERALEPAADVFAPEPRGAASSAIELRVGGAPGGDFAELFAGALAAQNRGDLVRAQELYEQLVLLRPEWAEAHNNLGTVLRDLGAAAAAEASFRQALALDPDFAGAWSNLGMLHAASGDGSEAVAALQHALALEPSSAATRVNLANVLHARGLPGEALALLEEAVASAPLMAEAHYALGRVLEALGRTADAIRHLDLFLVHAGGRFPEQEPRVREHVARLRGGG